MRRRPSKPLPIDLFRRIVGSEIFEALSEARRKLCRLRISYGTLDRLLTGDIISRIDDIAEIITGDRAHFHLKMHS